MRRAGLIACALAAGCALAPRAPGRGTWTFPPRYRAVQVVSVALPGGQRDFLASIVRDGRHVEVVLFEPALMVPLLSASGGDRPAAETVFLEGIPPGQGARLVELVAAMHAIAFEEQDGGAAAGRRAGAGFSLRRFEPAAGCRFPRVVEIELPAGGPAIRVETTDVACDGEAPPASPR